MMKLPRVFCPCCGSLVLLARSFSGFTPSKVVLVHKTSRLDYERMKNSHLSEDELQDKLSRVGSDYHVLLQRHQAHNNSLQDIISFLQTNKVTVRIRNRESYSHDDVRWADAIFSAGGDGNFLFTSSKVDTPDKPVVGFNTDPLSSEGYLCLSPPPSGSLTHLLEQVFRGEIPKIKRSRVRVHVNHTLLPVRALNEVFVGENHLSHASYYELSCDNGVSERQKSSGLLIYTGTGSTSWAYNVNKLASCEVEQLVNIAVREGAKIPTTETDPLFQLRVTQRYNFGHVFGGEEEKMAYTVREPIVRGIFAAKNIRGYANRISVRSLSWNATLVLDGHYHFKFPRGSIATYELHPQDSLTTLHNKLE